MLLALSISIYIYMPVIPMDVDVSYRLRPKIPVDNFRYIDIILVAVSKCS